MSASVTGSHNVISTLFTELSANNIIGSGTFGTVYKVNLLLADNTPSKDCFALKQIALSSAEAIIRECETLVLLQASKYVIKLLACIGCDYNERKECPMVYLLFPYFEKTLFKDYLPDISVDEFFAYSLALLKGLEFMHYYKLVHRDITPDNVLFHRKRKALKIIDVGIALPTHEMKGRVSGGTYGYRAPELLLGGSGQFMMDPTKADIWGAGQIFVNLLTGISPWFLYPAANSHLVNNDGFNLAQFCSFFGRETMTSCAQHLNVSLTVVFPPQEPLFPKGAAPVIDILSLRGQDSRFSYNIWKFVGKCWQPFVLERFSASEALLCLKALQLTVSKSGNSGDSSYSKRSITSASATSSVDDASRLLPQSSGYIEIVDPSNTVRRRLFYDFRGPHAWPYFFPFTTQESGEKAYLLQCPFRFVNSVDGVLKSGNERSTCTVTAGPPKRKWEITIPLTPSYSSRTQKLLSGSAAKVSVKDNLSSAKPPTTPPSSTCSVTRLLSTAKPLEDLGLVSRKYCGCCRTSYEFGLREAHLKGNIHRQAFMSKVLIKLVRIYIYIYIC